MGELEDVTPTLVRADPFRPPGPGAVAPRDGGEGKGELAGLYGSAGFHGVVSFWRRSYL